MSSESFNVWKVKYNLSLQDPDTVGTRHHTVIFVQNKAPSRDGHVHHVTGDLVGGMHYQTRLGSEPEKSATFNSKEFLGVVSAPDYPERFDQALKVLPAPARQKAFNTRTMRTEPIKPDGSFYAPGEPRAPLFKCTEWTETRAIPALFAQGLIRQGISPQQQQSQASSSTPDWVWDVETGSYKYWDGYQWVFQ